MKDEEIIKFAENLSKTRNEYLHAVQESLSGKDESIEFYLKNSKLKWSKRQWMQGFVDVKPVSLSTDLPDVLKQFLLHNSRLNTKIETLKHENEELKAVQNQLKEKLESIIKIKNSIEDELYKKFIIILNSKKEKIRELETELKNKNISSLNQSKSEWFDASTDDSEISGDEEINKSGTKISSFNGRVEREKLLKRHVEDDDERMVDSEFEEDKKSKKNSQYTDRKSIPKTSIRKSKELLVNRPSTSKIIDNVSPDTIESSKKIVEINTANSKISGLVNQFSSSSNESEEDMFP